MRLRKPPLGVAPRSIHDERRRQDIIEAITRYIEAGAKVPVDWVNEYNELTKRKEEQDEKN